MPEIFDVNVPKNILKPFTNLNNNIASTVIQSEDLIGKSHNQYTTYIPHLDDESPHKSPAADHATLFLLDLVYSQHYVDDQI